MAQKAFSVALTHPSKPEGVISLESHLDTLSVKTGLNGDGERH